MKTVRDYQVQRERPRRHGPSLGMIVLLIIVLFLLRFVTSLAAQTPEAPAPAAIQTEKS